MFSFDGPVVGYYDCFGANTGGVGRHCFYTNYWYLYPDGTYQYISESGNYTVSGNDVLFTPTSGSHIYGNGHLSTVGGITYMEFDYVYSFDPTIAQTLTFDRLGDVTGSASVSNSSSSDSIPSVPNTPITFIADDNGCCVRPDKGVSGHVQFKAPQTGSLNVTIYAPTGEKVLDTADSKNDISVTNGTTYDIAWDGTLGNLILANPTAANYTITGGSTKAAPGVYILRLNGAGISEIKKFVIVR